MTGRVNSNIPKKYRHIFEYPGLPKIVQEAAKLVGYVEGAGNTNNPVILAWADEVAKCMPTPYTNWAADWYNKDSIPWCGLFMAVVACRASEGVVNRAQRLPPSKYLSALAWADYGVAVQWKGREGLRLNEILCGDIGVFVRSGGGHVGIILAVSKDGKYVFVLGGNQDNAVNIRMLPISRLYAVRRPPYMTRPAGARHIRMDSTGKVTNSEQ